MRQFTIFIKKEFHHVFRDQKTLLLLFGMPIALIVLFGFALTNEIKNSKIVILDNARDKSSQRIIEKLASSDHFEIERTIFFGAASGGRVSGRRCKACNHLSGEI